MNNLKMTVASGTLMVLSALGVMSVAGSVGAQTPTQATAVATAVPVTGTPGVPAENGTTQGGRGGHMGGPMGGFGGGKMGSPGGRGGVVGTSESATREITNTTTYITLVKGDLAYATGKMDTAAVEGYLKTADSLVASAQSAISASQFGKAGETAQAARSLAQVADTLMAQALGADKLPSYSQRPTHPGGDMQGTTSTSTITQAQASRDLARTYNELVAQGTALKNAGNVAEASNLLTSAQNAYKQAYASYTAGKYSDAVASSRIASQLSRVVGELVQAVSAPANSDTPVTVPSPNF